jgi:diguanylate cyclase (GGDEF)-like protein
MALQGQERSFVLGGDLSSNRVAGGPPCRISDPRDITERKRRHDEVSRQANIDALTELPNRRAFDEVFQQEIARSRRYDRPLCVAIGDIDHFKIVNDTFGHPAGDAVLKRLADFIRQDLRNTDHIARWGGEEFAILLPETGLDVADRLLNRLRANIANYVIPEIGRAVTLSFGVTACTKSDDPGDLLERADRALYASKQHGRNEVTKLRRSVAALHPAAIPMP